MKQTIYISEGFEKNEIAFILAVLNGQKWGSDGLQKQEKLFKKRLNNTFKYSLQNPTQAQFQANLFNTVTKGEI